MIHSELLHLPFFIQRFSLTLGAFYVFGSGLNATAIGTGSSLPGKPRASGERGERDGEKKREGGREKWSLPFQHLKGEFQKTLIITLRSARKIDVFIKEERLELVIFGVPLGKSVVDTDISS